MFDQDSNDAPETVSVSSDEVEYLLDAVSEFCSARPDAQDVVWQYAGIRALYDNDQNNASKVTRGYRLNLDTYGEGAPALSVLGGKITTYRALAEEAVNKIAGYFPGIGEARTKDTKLPGGALGAAGFEEFVRSLARNRPGLPLALLHSQGRRHGSGVDDILGDARSPADLGCQIGRDLFERDVVYLKHNEWARSPEDVLWRRTKAGLHLSEGQRLQSHELLESML